MSRKAPHHPASETFVKAGMELGPAKKIDFQKRITEGVGFFPLNAKGRLRQSSSITYLHPLFGITKAFGGVDSDAQATKILIKNGKAIGTETTKGTIHANRAVVLALPVPFKLHSS